ncbi:hypothetical protein N7495_006862 [Penicillium taxi]|uniref:uncharacterized protein n=1 Tax=Penicillium taxi TaxID=168475 RepID=UPI0025451010|nr:uncharacterized protein N7495_006862 [Penicillium taxi]KAJ5895171.1 hypothetical protein N7495_006862 [Penicillium taxi]
MLPTILGIFLFSNIFPTVFGLTTTPGSPCESRCSKWGSTSSTNASEIVCLDTAYNTTSKGQAFADCVTCLLDSTFYDSGTGSADVKWGLYNLRFAFSTCVYGFPTQVSNVSSPCPVGCAGVQDAVEFDVGSPSVSNLDSWCDQSSFADNVVNTCEACYNGTTYPQQQLYLANFLESIRYNCHFPAVSGSKFDVSPTRIFYESLLPSSLSLTTPTSSHSGVNLGLVIAVPVIGFIIILIALGTCCFFFIRWRRRRHRKQRYQSHQYPICMDPSQAAQHGWDNQEQMYAQMHAAAAAGFVFVDSDGHPQDPGYGHELLKIPVQQDITETAPAQLQAQDMHGFQPDQKHAL